MAEAKSDQAANEVAFYYPGHLWGDSGWIKTLLLFFDGIGLLVPEYKKGEPEAWNPELAGPLRELGLLHYLIADEAVNEQATRSLVDALWGPIRAGAFDPLARYDTEFHALSMSRMGYFGDRDLAETLFRELRQRGLAKDSEDGVSVPLNPMIRYLILTLLAQILRARGTEMGLNLSPATDQTGIVDALGEILDLPAAASAGRVVALDLNTVAVNLDSIPLDEVMGFKKEHGAEYRAYARDVRHFAWELSTLPPDERAAVLRDRQTQLDDAASRLKRVSHYAWQKPASFALGLAGACWTYKTGDWMGALLGAGAVLTGGVSDGPKQVEAFSYLFSTNRAFPP